MYSKEFINEAITKAREAGLTEPQIDKLVNRGEQLGVTEYQILTIISKAKEMLKK